MERGFVLSVVLILAVAMFAGNLNSENSVTGKMVVGQEPTEKTCEEKCEAARKADKAKCVDDFNDEKEKIKNKLEGCNEMTQHNFEGCMVNAGTDPA